MEHQLKIYSEKLIDKIEELEKENLFLLKRLVNNLFII